jgi:hypothetical protein
MASSICVGPEFVTEIIHAFQNNGSYNSLSIYLNTCYSHEEQKDMLQQLQNCNPCILHCCRFPGKPSSIYMRKRTQYEKDNALCKKEFRLLARVLEYNIHLYVEIFGTML